MWRSAFLSLALILSSIVAGVSNNASANSLGNHCHDLTTTGSLVCFVTWNELRADVFARTGQRFPSLDELRSPSRTTGGGRPTGARPALQPGAPQMCSGGDFYVTLFEHINYGGASRSIAANIWNLSSIGWNDITSSSVYWSAYSRWEFEHEGYEGSGFTCKCNQPDYTTLGFNDKLTSIYRGCY